jgi:hypothetical protein
VGYPGTVLATVISYGYLVLFNLHEISKSFSISFRKVGIILLRTAIGVAIMAGVCFGLKAIGLNSVNTGRLLGLLKIFINLVLTFGVYLLITYFMKVPQMVFHRQFRLIRKKSS